MFIMKKSIYENRLNVKSDYIVFKQISEDQDRSILKMFRPFYTATNPAPSSHKSILFYEEEGPVSYE